MTICKGSTEDERMDSAEKESANTENKEAKQLTYRPQIYSSPHSLRNRTKY